MISGGNDFTDGNVQIYLRRDGKNVTLPLTNDYHKEIKNPTDKNPAEMSCEELAKSEPQLVITNNAIAAWMLNAFYTYLMDKLDYDEVYVDILTNNARQVRRNKATTE